MKHIFPEVTIDDNNWHTMQTVHPPNARHLSVKDRNGVEQLDIAVSSDGGTTWSETYRTHPGVPFSMIGKASGDVRVRVMRVSANTIYVQQTVEYY